MKRDRTRHVTSSGEGGEDNGEIIIPDPGAKNPETEILSRIGIDMITRVIRDLPENERIAMWLARVKGYQIESTDPEKRTVTQMMDISGSMVRRYLRRGEARLRKHPKLRAFMEDIL